MNILTGFDIKFFTYIQNKLKVNKGFSELCKSISELMSDCNLAEKIKEEKLFAIILSIFNLKEVSVKLLHDTDN